jgi:hypothetical protein
MSSVNHNGMKGQCMQFMDLANPKDSKDKNPANHEIDL